MTPGSTDSVVSRTLLTVRRLQVRVPARRWWPLGPPLRLLDGLDLDLAEGESVALLGERGCGRTTLARVVAGEQVPTAGMVRIADDGGASDDSLPREALRRRVLRVDAPRWSRKQGKKTVARWFGGVPAGDLAVALREMELDPQLRRHRLSALGADQSLRLVLARELITAPSARILVLDRPELGLDRDARLRLRGCVQRICSERGLAQLLITDDFDWARRVCRRVIVVYLGRVMEQGPTAEVFDTPAHPYTRALLASAAGAHGRQLDGPLPDPKQPPIGCVFHTRCPMAEALCVRTVPHLQRSRATGHHAACHFVAREE